MTDTLHATRRRLEVVATAHHRTHGAGQWHDCQYSACQAASAYVREGLDHRGVVPAFTGDAAWNRSCPDCHGAPLDVDEAESADGPRIDTHLRYGHELLDRLARLTPAVGVH